MIEAEEAINAVPVIPPCSNRKMLREKEKSKDPDMSTWTALKNVLIPECFTG